MTEIERLRAELATAQKNLDDAVNGRDGEATNQVFQDRQRAEKDAERAADREQAAADQAKNDEARAGDAQVADAQFPEETV